MQVGIVGQRQVEPAAALAEPAPDALPCRVVMQHLRIGRHRRRGGPGGRVLKLRAVGALAIGLGRRAFRQHHVMAVQFEVVIFHPPRILGPGDQAVVDQLLHRNQHACKIKTVAVRDV
jgi:hypothetical protein